MSFIPVPSKNPAKAARAALKARFVLRRSWRSSPIKAPAKGPKIIPGGPAKIPAMSPSVAPQVPALDPPDFLVKMTGARLSRIETITAAIRQIITTVSESSALSEK